MPKAVAGRRWHQAQSWHLHRRQKREACSSTHTKEQARKGRSLTMPDWQLLPPPLVPSLPGEGRAEEGEREEEEEREAAEAERVADDSRWASRRSEAAIAVGLGAPLQNSHSAHLHRVQWIKRWDGSQNAWHM